MKRHKRLELERETIRYLSGAQLRGAIGGGRAPLSDTQTHCYDDESFDCPSEKQPD